LLRGLRPFDAGIHLEKYNPWLQQIYNLWL